MKKKSFIKKKSYQLCPVKGGTTQGKKSLWLPLGGHFKAP
jgi:hypothetical protein